MPPPHRRVSSVRVAATDAASTSWRQSFGADDGTNRRSFHGNAQTGVATGNADSIYSNNRALLIADNDTPALEAVADVTWTAKKPTVTWSQNNAVATKYGYLALGDANLFQAYTAGEAVAFGGRLGNNLQFSAAVRAELIATAQGFGNAGNWTGSNVAEAYAALTGTGIGFDRYFTGVVAAEALATSKGYGFSRQLTGMVTAEALQAVAALLIAPPLVMDDATADEWGPHEIATISPPNANIAGLYVDPIRRS